MAKAKTGKNISRQALLQRNFSALAGPAVGHIFRADKFAQQPHALAQSVAGLDSTFAPALVDDGSRVIKILVGAAEVGLAFQPFAIVLDFKTVSHANARKLMLRAGKLGAEHGLAGQLHIRSKSKQAVS